MGAGLPARLIARALAAFLMIEVVSAVAAGNAVPSTRVSQSAQAITANSLKPSQCASLSLTALVTGSGDITATSSAELILGGPASQTIIGAGGDDCILAGDGNDFLSGGAGNDVLICGGGTDTAVGGLGTDTNGGGCETFFQDAANTGLLSCTANAAVTTGSGDNNGFQLNPGNACANDAAFAEDTNSGSNTTSSCTDAGKDRHLFYNYGFSILAGSTIDGIEVRLDAWADATGGGPFMCVELSWNGGTTWTAAKTTTSLGTTEATFTLGTSADTWGRTWASTDFADANFRVRITNVATNANRDFRLDWAAVQVTYSPP